MERKSTKAESPAVFFAPTEATTVYFTLYFRLNDPVKYGGRLNEAELRENARKIALYDAAERIEYKEMNDAEVCEYLQKNNLTQSDLSDYRDQRNKALNKKMKTLKKELLERLNDFQKDPDNLRRTPLLPSAERCNTKVNQHSWYKHSDTYVTVGLKVSNLKVLDAWASDGERGERFVLNDDGIKYALFNEKMRCDHLTLLNPIMVHGRIFEESDIELPFDFKGDNDALLKAYGCDDVDKAVEVDAEFNNACSIQ